MELRHNQQESRLAAEGASPPSGSPIRTYAQVAKILGAQYGVRIGAERVRRICIAAETKLARAFLADPLLRDHMLDGDNRRDETTLAAGRTVGSSPGPVAGSSGPPLITQHVWSQS